MPDSDFGIKRSVAKYADKNEEASPPQIIRVVCNRRSGAPLLRKKKPNFKTSQGKQGIHDVVSGQ
jgi:hypothetical protein